MKSNASSPKEYLEELSEDRRKAISKVRAVIRKNLPNGYQEVMQYGMISYVVPLRLFPEGYLGDGKTPLPYISLGNQKNHMAVYLSNVYGNKQLEGWFRKKYQDSGKKLDMGKSCVRFKKLEDLPLEVIGQVVAKTTPQQMIDLYKKARQR